MTIRHLRMFQAVCEAGSVTAAADSLYMTQPAVSRTLSELEEEFGAPLFDRMGRRLYLNGMGRAFLEKAARALRLFDEMERGAAALEREAPVRLGSSITIAAYWLPRALRAFGEECPDTPLTVTVDRAAGVMDRLESGEVDMALAEGAPVPGPYVRVPFSSYRLCAVAAPGSLLAAGPRRLADLAGETWLLREKGSAVRDMLDSALLLEGLSVEPRMTSVDSQALIQAVKAGLGISVLPEILVREDIRAGALTEIALEEPPLVSENAVVLHRDKYRTPSMDRLIECLKNADPFG